MFHRSFLVYFLFDIIDMSLKQIVTPSLAARRRTLGRVCKECLGNFLPFLCGTYSRSPCVPSCYKTFTDLDRLYRWNLQQFLTLGHLGPLHMSPVAGLARLPRRILWFVHMGNFSPVDRDEIQETRPKLVEHKLLSFATVIALWTLVTLLMKL